MWASPFPISTPVTIGLRAGEIFGPSRQVTLIDGEANNVIVRLRRTPGETRIWVEDNLPRDDETPPTYAAGASDVPLFFDHPKIEDIQITDDECCNSLQGQRVETRGKRFQPRLHSSAPGVLTPVVLARKLIVFVPSPLVVIDRALKLRPLNNFSSRNPSR